MIDNFFNYINIKLKFSPLIYNLYNNIKKNNKKLVSRNTDLILEGYPRCGNTFAFFVLLNFRNLNIAHHTHSLVNIKEGLKRDLPVCILIRYPYDAIASEVLRKIGFDKDQNIDDLINFEMLYYQIFYKYINSININNILICEFDVLINKTQEFIKNIHFKLLQHDVGILTSDIENLSIKEIEKNKNLSKKQIEKKENLKKLDSKSMSIPNNQDDRYEFKKDIIKKIKSKDKNNKLLELYLEIKDKSI